MCAFVPLNPNELTPAVRGPLTAVQAVGAVGTVTGSSLQAMCGLGSRKCSDAGISRCCSASTVLITDAMPAADSRCPTFVFTDPMTIGCSGRAALTERRAQRTHLDRIAERRAGAVRLDVIDLSRLHAGLRQRLADQRLLRRAARHGQAAAAAVLVDRALRG